MIIMSTHELETALNETIKDLEIIHPTIEPGTDQCFKATLLSAESHVTYMMIVYQLYTMNNKKYFRLITPPKACNVPTLVEKINAYTKEHSTSVVDWFVLLRDTAKHQLLEVQDPLYKFQEFKEHFLKHVQPNANFRIRIKKESQNETYTTFTKVYVMYEPGNAYISARYTYHNDDNTESAITRSHPTAYDLFTYLQEYISQEMQNKETQCISIESSLYDNPFYIYR